MFLAEYLLGKSLIFHYLIETLKIIFHFFICMKKYFITFFFSFSFDVGEPL
jgi:hypothetical protein